jgi:enoyl-CoA hydratase
MSYETIRLDVSGSIALLTIDRPKALNALNAQALGELEQALKSIPALPEVRGLIITGAGDKAFVAGADISEMAELSTEAARQFSATGQRVLALLESLSIPTLAAVNGFALGGGCELALACDLVYAADNAKLGLPEVGLGVIPGFGGTQRLVRRLGRARAKELIFTGDRLDAARARDLGLVLDVLPPAKLLEHCRAVLARISKNGPLAVAQAKRVIELGADADQRVGCELEQQAFGALFGSADQREGMKAFMEKRAPSFVAK